MNQESSAHVPSGSGKGVLLFLGLAVAFWGVLGWMDINQQGYGGVTLNRDFIVTAVDPNTPASMSTIDVGDQVTHIERVPVEDVAQLARLDRTDIGERRVYWVDKFDPTVDEYVEMDYRLRHVALDNHAKSKARARIIVGFCFLLMPLAGWLITPNRATRILVMVGAGLGLSFMGGPYMVSYDLRAMFAAVEGLFVYIGLAAMIHFLLVFPHLRPFLSRPSAKKLIYLPALALWLLLCWRLFVPPASDSFVNIVIDVATGLIIGGYLLVGLILLLRNFARTSSGERKALGFNTMLIGSLVALLPVLVGNIVAAVSPAASLPGQEYYFLSVVLIPMTWSLAAKKLG